MHLQLLHTPSLQLADGRLLPLAANDAALFAVLAIDGPTSRETMAELLWPDSPGEGARVNLRQRLSRWKARAGLVLLQPGGGNLLALPPPPGTATAALGSVGLSHDLRDLPARLQLDPAAGSGELLGSFAYDDNPRFAQWLQRARAQWHGTRLEAMAAIAERLEHEHRLAEALPYASRIALDDPLAEHAHRRVMRLHYLRGDRGAALAAYDRLRTLLRDELGTIPSRETLELARIVESSGGGGPAAANAPAPVSVLRPPRMVGRAAEWEQLAQAWRTARPVVVSGEPGIGKSRLTRDFAEAQGAVLLARSRPGDAREPYSTLVRLLREAFARFADNTPAGCELPAWARTELARLAGEPAIDGAPGAGRASPGSATPGRLEPARLRQALAAALQHWQALGARSLLVDDAQFADTASLELLLAWHRHATDAERAADEPLRLLLTARSNEAVPAVTRWLAEQAHGAGAPLELRLGPLDGDAVAALIESLALAELEARHWAGPLLRHTGGNPLFIVQTLITALNSRIGLLLGDAGGTAATPLPLPEQVAALIEQRLKRLSPDALRLARVAAIAGADFNADLAAAVLQTHAVDLIEPWTELERHAILREHGFAHDLLHEVTLRSVPQPIARVLHRGVAQALQGRPVAPARLADHWLQAGEWALSGAAFVAAAAAAAGASRRAEELAFLDQAASALSRAGDRAAAFQARLRAVDAAVVVDPGEAVAQRLAALLADAADAGERLDALLAQCKQLLSDADFQAAREPAGQAMALALDQPDAARRVAAAGWHGLVLALSGELAAGLAVFDSRAADAAGLADDAVALDFFGAQGYALHHASRFQASLAPMRRALGLAQRLGNLNEAMVQAVNVGLVLRRTGERGAALAAFEQALDGWRRLDEPRGVSAASLHMYVGVLHAEAGRYGAALQALGGSVEQMRSGRAVDWVAKAEHRLAAVYLALGQPAKARQALTALADDASAADRLARLMTMCRLPGPEQDAFAARLAACVTRPADDVPAMDRLSAELLLSALSPPERAVELSSAARARALALAAPAVALHALVRHADALRRSGDAAGAAALAEAALADRGDCDEHGFHDLQPGEFWWLAFSALHAGRRDAAAQQALAAGAERVRRIAREQVPAEFVDGFLNRNPYNRDLLAAAARRR